MKLVDAITRQSDEPGAGGLIQNSFPACGIQSLSHDLLVGFSEVAGCANPNSVRINERSEQPDEGQVALGALAHLGEAEAQGGVVHRLAQVVGAALKGLDYLAGRSASQEGQHDLQGAGMAAKQSQQLGVIRVVAEICWPLAHGVQDYAGHLRGVMAHKPSHLDKLVRDAQPTLVRLAGGDDDPALAAP